jgi:hypothetical protein
MFPLPPPERIPGPFVYTIIDLESVDLVIEPTTHIHEHLQLDGDILKILQLNQIEISALRTFHDNRVAKYVTLTCDGEVTNALLPDSLGSRG